MRFQNPCQTNMLAEGFPSIAGNVFLAGEGACSSSCTEEAAYSIEHVCPLHLALVSEHSQLFNTSGSYLHSHTYVSSISLQQKVVLIILNCILLFGIFTVKFFQVALDYMSKIKKHFFFPG